MIPEYTGKNTDDFIKDDNINVKGLSIIDRINYRAESVLNDSKKIDEIYEKKIGDLVSLNKSIKIVLDFVINQEDKTFSQFNDTGLDKIVLNIQEILYTNPNLFEKNIYTIYFLKFIYYYQKNDLLTLDKFNTIYSDIIEETIYNNSEEFNDLEKLNEINHQKKIFTAKIMFYPNLLRILEKSILDKISKYEDESY